MNPLKYLSPAIYAALAAAPLVSGAASVPVYRAVPGNESGHYIFLQQPTATEVSGSRGCRQWTCTQLVDVVTQFASDAYSIEPADELADQILLRLEATNLVLPAGWQTDRGLLQLASELQETDGSLLLVRRLLRLRWNVSYSPVAGAPAATTSVVVVPTSTPTSQPVTASQATSGSYAASTYLASTYA